MFQDFINAFIRWGNTTTERQKLQHTYLVLALILILIAGLVGLVSNKWGHNLAYLALASIVAFVANGVIWNLLNSAVISRLPARTKRK
jgi:hypothetical protein